VHRCNLLLREPAIESQTRFQGGFSTLRENKCQPVDSEDFLRDDLPLYIPKKLSTKASRSPSSLYWVE
jgi:hypothetical protein